MKKIIFIFCFSLIFFPLTSLAGEGWVIDSFKSNIEIQSDGKVKISEEIAVDFGNLEKHGIFRDIPYKYKTKNSDYLYTEIKVLAITDKEGLGAPYSVSDSGSYLRIKIGDTNKTISGKQVYKINYQVNGVLSGYDKYDELYWNVTGNNWPVPIKVSEAKVRLPAEGLMQTSCYVGYFGSKEQCQNNEIENNQQVVFLNSRILSAGEGMTVAVGYSKGLVPILHPVPVKTRTARVLEEFISLPVVLIATVIFFISLFFLLRLWWSVGRDYHYKRKSLQDENSVEEIMPLGAYELIKAEYEPPGKLRPAEIGVLIDERAHTIDVSATIIDLAVRGFLTIKEEKKKWLFGKVDYIFTRTNKKAENLNKYEEILLSSLFKEGDMDIKLSELKNSFYKDLDKVKKELYREVVVEKLFDRNPENVRLKYLFSAIGVLVFGAVIACFGYYFVDGILLGLGTGVLLAGLFFVFLSFYMPRKTARGRELYRQARGYKLFVAGTEKYRQPFFEKENIFMEVLPYAIVFGVTKKLARALDDMGIKEVEPSWYVGVHPFNLSIFASNMDDFSRSLSSAIASSPSGSGSGGRGFSGGGFGGGGGGSW